jgi:hypothetical protein
VQAEYEEEGIPWSHVQFADNAEVLRLLESSTGTHSKYNQVFTYHKWLIVSCSYTSVAMAAKREIALDTVAQAALVVTSFSAYHALYTCLCFSISYTLAYIAVVYTAAC